MSDWDKLVAASVLGTSRGSVPALSKNGALGKVLQLSLGDRGRTDEQKFLDAAALAGLHAEAGRLPVKANTPPVQCDPEEDGWKQCSAKSGEQLYALLTGKVQKALLTEWLETAVSVRRLVPPLLIPRLLDYHAREGAGGKLVAQVCGARGRLLTQMNENWHTIADRSGDFSGDPEQIWQTGRTFE